jgi:hypothetical protein
MITAILVLTATLPPVDPGTQHKTYRRNKIIKNVSQVCCVSHWCLEYFLTDTGCINGFWESPGTFQSAVAHCCLSLVCKPLPPALGCGAPPVLLLFKTCSCLWVPNKLHFVQFWICPPLSSILLHLLPLAAGSHTSELGFLRYLHITY